MKHKEALEAANKIVEQLAPYCDRIEIAGSIRREHPEPRDIEIVCIPKTNTFGARELGFTTLVESWQKVKGDPRNGKYTQRVVDGITLDLFMCGLQNWGYILAIRTGSGEYSHKTLGYRWRQMGYVGREGNLYHEKSGTLIETPTEEGFFNLLNIPFDPPHRRMSKEEKIAFVKKYGHIDILRIEEHKELEMYCLQVIRTLKITAEDEGIIRCPRCQGMLRYVRYPNGHTAGRCKSNGCLHWRE